MLADSAIPVSGGTSHLPSLRSKRTAASGSVEMRSRAVPKMDPFLICAEQWLRTVVSHRHAYFEARWAPRIPIRFLRIRLHSTMATESPQRLRQKPNVIWTLGSAASCIRCGPPISVTVGRRLQRLDRSTEGHPSRSSEFLQSTG